MFTLKQVNGSIVYTPSDITQRSTGKCTDKFIPRPNINKRVNDLELEAWVHKHQRPVNHIIDTFLASLFSHASDSCKVTIDTRKFERLMKEKLYKTSDMS